MLFDDLKQLSRDGPLTLQVDGDCMFDTVHNGARVQIERRSVYWPGDIVVYGRGDDRLVMHRFLGFLPRRRGWYGVTRADESNKADAPVSVGRLLGKVLYIEGVPARPSIWQRVQSLAHYLVALLSLSGRLIARFFRKIGVFR